MLELPYTSMPVPATPIGDLLKWQLDIQCSRCRRRVVLRLQTLMQRHDRAMRIGEVIRRLRCDGTRREQPCRAVPSKVVLMEVTDDGKSMRKLRGVTVVGG